MINIDYNLTPETLGPKLDRFWQRSGEKIQLIEDRYDASKGSPVFTDGGRYTTRGWTEWTQGFQYGSAILQYDATGDPTFLEIGRRNTVEKMAPHLSHIGVHDHGFNNISTYGNLLRLMCEGRIEEDSWERDFYTLALKISGAVQAARWTSLPEGGFIHSFNGPHSLFVDTVRSCRALVVSHAFGHQLMAEGDRPIDLLLRAIQHLSATAKYSIYYGEGRDAYDEWGRTAHESIFNTKDGAYRCPNSQQGYSGFTTWTRGLAWAMCGFAEQLEYFDNLSEGVISKLTDREGLFDMMEKAARATCDWYINNSPLDGIPYWDGGAPNLHRLDNYLNRNSDPFNEWEPIDSSAAAIGAQGLIRLGKYLLKKGDAEAGIKYQQAGLTVVNHLFDNPYLSEDPDHEGLILHSIYHQPNGWDTIPENGRIASGEASMWGDYHAREVALYLKRMVDDEPDYTFFGCIDGR